jgi:hypothetical protein
MTLRGAHIADDFKKVVEDYIEKRFGAPADTAGQQETV